MLRLMLTRLLFSILQRAFFRFMNIYSSKDVTMALYCTLLIFCMLKVAHAFTTGSMPILRLESNAPSAVALAAEPVSVSSVPSEDSGDIFGKTTGVTLKIAFDSQGGVADLSSEKSERFTCGESLDMVHRLRRVSDCVLVGRSTVEIDDCTLTVRRVPMIPSTKKQPVRVIVDPRLNLELDRYQISQDGLATIIVHAVTDDIANFKSKPELKKDVYEVPYVKTVHEDYPNVTLLGLRPVDSQGKQRLCTRQICDILEKEFNIQHIMVEGGPDTALQFLKDGIVDRAILVYAPISFKNPLLSSISTEILDQAGLELIGHYALGVDSVKCFKRPSLQWPSTDISSWP